MATRNQNPYLGASDIKWRHKKFSYTSGNLIYLGKSLNHNPSTSAGQLWWIWKFIYSGTDVIDIIGPLSGNWDDRATLTWT